MTDGLPDRFDHHTTRYLSAMRGQFIDQKAYQERLTKEDPLLYDVFEIKLSEMPGELQHGVSVIHPGKVGDEYFMTKGHFHLVLDTAEVYYCLRGDGVMVMETPEGDWSVEEMHPGTVVYVPPRWAHRSVNVNLESDLVLFFVYPSNAGHDYGSIEQQGFRKLILDRDGRYEIVDNPNWLPPDLR
ncbi:MAG: glucose-6-phosphate isomerase [Anaerolineae bacterium SM23_ 63]|nr:MAG: glucose-6-phosphate isomerase [Anaerolineae bacterium SM23_ 63]